ncbi:O-methyltransferase [Halarcobacter bivalviorum]|uniref:Methyltransferase n=1 Tax=Halarcobacter bivalviorum TaxID=663364 RepID=A0AAX2A8Z2_9BACT|nr:class I SAM-dependent methyltransferase [Halarcobacter bivalviorum]AXH13443.1 O-methyltransferase [Halarcobacter bivalviorum]RXK09959.1 methyltransferase [Halarcobacter bivalviorum]
MQLSKEDLTIFNEIEKIREEIKAQRLPIILKDYGAGDPEDNRDEKQMYEGVEKSTNSFDLCSIGLKNEWAQKLYFLVKENKPKRLLELGTCCGFSSIYMSKANKNSTIFTVEGDCNVAKLASNNIKKANCSNIKQYIGKFQDILADVLEEIAFIDFAFIDGHHDKDATIKYFHQIKPFLTENAIVVFDDISWSEGMKEAWEIIKKDSSIERVEDLQKLGICYINKG